MDIEEQRLKALKNRAWFTFLKDYYEPEDVIRYFDEVERSEQFNRTFHIRDMFTIPPERFFNEDTLSKGLKLLKERDLNKLKKELEYLKEIKIPQLEQLINNFK